MPNSLFAPSSTTMIVYKDIISGDEAISDSYKIQPVMENGEEVPGLIEADSALIAVGVGDIDIGCGNAFGGAGADEGADDTVEKENNIAGSRAGFGYQVSLSAINKGLFCACTTNILTSPRDSSGDVS